MRRPRRVGPGLAVLATCLASAAPRADAVPPSDVERTVVRYVRLEAWLDRHRDAGVLEAALAARPDVSRAFLSGRYDEVVRRLDATVLATADAVGADPPRLRAAVALDLEIAPDGAADLVRGAIDAPVRVPLRVVDGAGRPLAEFAALDAAPFAAPVPPTAGAALPGHRIVHAAVGPDGAPWSRWIEVGRTTVGIDAAAEAARLEARLADLAAAAPDEPARRRTAGRIAQLRELPVGPLVHRFAIDAGALAREIDADLDALARGEDPFASFTGDRWVPLRLADADIPCRVIVPAAARAAAAPAPLLVALHGAGGNEHLFVDGHGGGRIGRLAAERGAIVVAPRTTAMLGPGAFDDLLEELASMVPVDRDRVLVIGHSLGGVIGGTLASGRADRIAAAALVAGAPPVLAAGSPRVLVVAGGVDRVVPAAPLEAAAERARAAGIDATYRRLDDADHLLVVPAALDAAIRWLFDGVID